MTTSNEIDEIITVDEIIESGFFYLENRQFHGPFESNALASASALENCQLSKPGECRAIYQGSVKRNPDTNLNEPTSDMRQISTVECPTIEHKKLDEITA